MRRLDRYVTKELAVPLLTGTVIIAFLFAANELIAIFNQLNVATLNPAAIAQLVLLKMPQWLILTLPVGMAIGASLSIGRMARESEITALRATGTSIRRILLPIAVWGILIGGLDFWISEDLHPKSADRYRTLAQEVLLISAQPRIQTGATFVLGRYNVRIGRLERRTDGTLFLEECLLFEVMGPDEVIVTQARRGDYSGGTWRFPNATIRWLKGLELVQFKSEDVSIVEPISVGTFFSQSREAKEMTLNELREAIKQNAALKTVDQKTILEAESRIAIPASCLIFALTGALAALRFSRSSPFIGLMVSLILVAMYYNLHIICQIIGQNGWLPPLQSAWLPNTLYVILGILLYWRLD